MNSKNSGISQKNGATPAGTQNYFQKHSLSVPPVRFGKTEWMISPVGFGGYRVHDQDATHREALKLALTSGCNLIDTSTNYMNGGSERLIGSVLKEFFDSGKLQREEVVVVSKVGYVQGENLELAKLRITDGNPFPEMVNYAEGCWHCISPEFLEDQITRSLARLGLETLDAVLLHNPEYYLKTEADHAEYYRRIRIAFEHLEREAGRGRIQFYGISSNTFPAERESPEYTSLETVLEISDQLSTRSRFAVIQFPFNLFEPGAVFETNNTGKSVSELAASRDLGTLINRPLNAFTEHRMVRLADFPHHHGEPVEENLRSSLEAAMQLESKFSGTPEIPAHSVAWGHILKKNVDKLLDLDYWKQVLHFQIRPTLGRALHSLSENEEYGEWARKYGKASEKLFQSFTAFLESQLAMKSRTISAQLDQACPRLKNSRSLSQKVVRIYRSVPGFHGILVGMRRPEYVRDMLELQIPLKPEEAVDAIEAVQEVDEHH